MMVHIDESLRMTAHPGIMFRDGPAGRRPGLTDGPDIWEVARVFNGCVSESDALIERAERLIGLKGRQLRVALRYYAAFTDEIDEWMQRVDEEADQAQAAWLREQRPVTG